MKSPAQIPAPLAASLLLALWTPAFGQQPVITSFSQNGQLTCTNLRPGSLATIEWASSLTGAWTNNWIGLNAVAADSNGVINVSVPMFYRVRALIDPNDSPTNMVIVPSGLLTMGDAFGDWPASWGPNPEIPTHPVFLSPFFMDKWEVTKGLWDNVYHWATNHGYTFDSGIRAQGKAVDHPVHSVRWNDAVKWCNARSEKEGRTPAYYTDAAQTNVFRNGLVVLQDESVNWSAGYRLPTEAEWEKAARGGENDRRFPWPDTDTIQHIRANYFSTSNDAYDTSLTRNNHAAFSAGSEPFTSPVGYFAPNAYGIYDMAGNVSEFCWDFWGTYSSAQAMNPHGPVSPTPSTRIVRGGGWNDRSLVCRVACRLHAPSDYSGQSVGFRCVLPLIQ